MSVKSNATLDTELAALKTAANDAQFNQKIIDTIKDLNDHLQDVQDSLDHVMTDFGVSISFSAASAAANVCEVTITVLDNEGSAVDVATTSHLLDIWLSDDAQGEGLTSTSASGTVTAKSSEGAVLTALTAKKHIRGVTKAGAGTFILEITDTAKTGFYVCAALPGSGRVYVSDQLVTGDYGS